MTIPNFFSLDINIVISNNIYCAKLLVLPLYERQQREFNKHLLARYYDDYQTSRGINYARSVNAYFKGTIEATYITFNDHFEIIEKVDPAKLQVPEGYDSKIPKWDGMLV
jgi:hypothetical protein